MQNNKQILALAMLLANHSAVALDCGEWPDNVYLLRHAEKVDSKGSDSVLSAKGWCMAETLPLTLAGENITAIFVTKKKRTQETAASLSEHTGIVPTAISKDDRADLASAICNAGRPGQTETVVVIGHESTVPKVMEDLGVPGSVPTYGDIFGVVPTARSVVSARYGDLCSCKACK